IPSLSVHTISFASHMIAYSRSCQEITLIGRIDKHLSHIGVPTERRDGNDTISLFQHSLLPVQPLLTPNLQIVFFHIVLEYLLCHVRFKYPHGTLISIYSRSSLSFVAIFRLLLPAPGRTVLIVSVHPVIKITCQATDDGLVTSIRKTKPTRRQSTQMRVRRYYYDGFSGFLRLHSSSDGCRSTSIDDHVSTIFMATGLVVREQQSYRNNIQYNKFHGNKLIF